MTVSPYPLCFRPILMPKVWGGRRLASFGKVLPQGQAIGESWEVADMPTTSTGGAGGGAQRSVVVNGPLAGRTLADAMILWPGPMLGTARPPSQFPLLVKFLDAAENLSVQVHPSPGYARTHADAHLKTECWYILDAAPGSVIYKGVKPGVTREAFAGAIASGGVVDLLIAEPAVPGECHNLPSGTCHALGAGVLVAEVQTPSDTTFRVFDWGRTGRELHVAQSLECIHWGPAPPAVKMKAGEVLKTEFFEVRHASVGPGAERAADPQGRCTIVMVLAGSGSLYAEQGLFAPLTLRTGDTILVPGTLAPDATLAPPDSGRLECLLASVV